MTTPLHGDASRDAIRGPQSIGAAGRRKHLQDGSDGADRRLRAEEVEATIPRATAQLSATIQTPTELSSCDLVRSRRLERLTAILRELVRL